ncbi:MAG: FkbM family methyltransferase [Thermoplasmata archaeon]|jgi:FkbM family methyltransferase
MTRNIAISEIFENPVLIKYALKAMIKSKFKIIKLLNNYDTLIDYLFSPDMIGIFGIVIENDYLKIKYKGKEYKFKKYGNVRDMGARLVEQFIIEQYSIMNIKDKIVIDIGAYLADSPIFFYANNAKKVIGFEPFPKIYEKALENVILNGLQENIVLYNLAIYKEDGYIFAKDNEGPYSGLELNGGREIKINTITIDHVLSNFKNENVILKIDCEGCERFIFDHKIDLSCVSEIIVEYDYGYDYILESLKEQDFRVRLINKPKKINGRTTGLLYANKVS